ncbi:hypothetical protein AZA_90701 [Nitrospirillum viridazoti Y2]|nr:hypothetical protein AZA_90701 [Nitrospirillum amazonense Y2]
MAPFHDESLIGFVTRTAAENGCSRTFDLVRAWARPNTTLFAYLTAPDLDMAAIGDFLAMTPDEISAMAYVRPDMDEKSVVLMGAMVSRDFVNPRRKHLCPHCCQDEPYHRRLWDFAAAVACPVHGTLLIHECPDCGKALTWRSSSWTYCCGCGFDLLKADPEPAGDMRGPLGLAGLFKASPGHPLIAALGVDGAIRLVYMLGQAHQPQDGRLKQISTLARRRPKVFLECLNGGWDACADWPASFYRYLDDLRAQASGREGKYGLVKEYGSLALRIMGKTSDPKYAVIRRKFMEHVANLPLPVTNSRYIGEVYEELGMRRYLRMQEAVALFKTSPPKMKKLAESWGVFVVLPQGRGSFSVLDAEKVENLKRHLEQFVSKEGAARILGVPWKVMERLEQLNLICKSDDPDADVIFKIAYRRADLKSLVDSIRKGLRRYAAPYPKHFVDMATFIRKLPFTAHKGEQWVIEAIKKGHIQPVGVRGQIKGLAGLLFAEDQLDAFAAAYPKTALSITEVADVLGIERQAVAHLRRRGFIEGGSGRVRTVQPIVAPQALAKFNEQFVMTAEIHRRCGVTASAIPRLLRKAGVRPVSGPSVDGGRRFVFRRDDQRLQEIIEIWRRHTAIVGKES